MIDSPRSTSDPDGARELLARVLRDGGDLAAEYPLVFGSGFGGRVLAVAEEGRARAACAVLVRDFHLGDGPAGEPLVVRGGLIGSIATEEGWRNRGLGTRLLSDAEAALAAEGCAFVLLWARKAGFYLERGYAPIGIEQDFVVERALAQALPEVAGARDATADDAAAIHALYERHPVRLGRSARETAALLTCPGMTTLVVERDGAAVAYACLGRGADFPGVLHEWGGGAQDVLGLVRAHFERRFGAEEGRLFVMAPPAAEELRAAFAAHGCEPHLGYLGLARLADRAAAARLLDQCLRPVATIALAETPEGPRFHLASQVKEGWLDDDAALAVLFPVAEVRPAVEQLVAGFGIPPGRLPLSPFAWGLDSI